MFHFRKQPYLIDIYREKFGVSASFMNKVIMRVFETWEESRQFSRKPKALWRYLEQTVVGKPELLARYEREFQRAYQEIQFIERLKAAVQSSGKM